MSRENPNGDSIDVASPKIDQKSANRRLMTRRSELITSSIAASDARKIVALDQQSVGRLSRQDALQQQAMAKAQDARRVNELRRVDAALIRIEAGDYGWCAECGSIIAAKRLEIDPTAEHCVVCAR